MNLKATSCAILLASVSLTACSLWLPSYSAKNTVTTPIRLTSSVQSLPTFSKLVLTGPLHVILKQQGKPMMEVTGPQKAVGNIVAEVKEDTLYLRSMRNVPVKEQPNVTVYINSAQPLTALTFNSSGTLTATHLNTPELNILVNSGQRIDLSGPRIGLRKLTVLGPTPIHIRGIHSDLLDVDAQRAADITLDGVAGLRNLDYYGPGKFHLQWVKGHRVNIHSHQGHIFLAGIADALDAVLSREGNLNARYLRVNNAFVNTADNAKAEIFVKNKFNAFASGSSNIYYYHTPRLLTKYMRQKGSVLQIVAAKPCTDNPCELGFVE